jgi:NAD+ diphosphatase
MSDRIWFVVHARGLVVRREGDGVVFPTEEEVRSFGLDPAESHAIGLFSGKEALAVPLGEADVLAPFEALGLRALAGVFDEAAFAAAGRAMHVVDWAVSHRFCGRCGTPTKRVAHERNLSCPACGQSAYPRIAPAIIVLVRRGKEALLAKNAKFPYAFYSTLAGFSDIGESLEETLAREVREEVGIGVKNIRYFGSQPWPFPHSLMIGFTAEWAEGEIAVDGDEIADARWFTADALPPVPPPISIARKLIDAWVAEVT